MSDLRGTGHLALLLRVLEKTGLGDINDVSRVDLILAFEDGEGRDRSPFERPQISNRTNGGLYDRKFLPTAMTRLRSVLWEVTTQLERDDSSHLSDSSPDRPLTPHDKHQKGSLPVEERELSGPSPRKKRRGDGDLAAPPRKVQYVAMEVVPDDSNADENHDPEMWGTYMVGMSGAHHPENLVRDYPLDLANPGQFRISDARTTLEHYALEGLLTLGTPANGVVAQSGPLSRDAEDTEEEQLGEL